LTRKPQHAKGCLLNWAPTLKPIFGKAWQPTIEPVPSWGKHPRSILDELGLEP